MSEDTRAILTGAAIGLAAFLCYVAYAVAT